MDVRIDKKWAEILQYAREHALEKGVHHSGSKTIPRMNNY